MTRLAFTDVESTGLDPTRHEVWEVAVILRDHQQGVHDEEHRLLIRPRDLAAADPGALRVGRFYARAAETDAATDWRTVDRPIVGVHDGWVHPAVAAERIATLTAGAHLVGANPAFDAAFLTSMLARNGFAPAWHYRLIDVEALVAGAVRWETPKSLRDSAAWLDLTVDEAALHTALGDARLARDVYDAVIAPRPGTLAAKQAKVTTSVTAGV